MLCTTASIVVMLDVLLRDEAHFPRPSGIGLTDGILLMQAPCQHFLPRKSSPKLKPVDR